MTNKVNSSNLNDNKNKGSCMGPKNTLSPLKVVELGCYAQYH